MDRMYHIFYKQFGVVPASVKVVLYYTEIKTEKDK